MFRKRGNTSSSIQLAPDERNLKLRVASMFLTLDGEVTGDGPLRWSFFVRTGGCNLRCWRSSGYCDAPHTLALNYPYPVLDIRDVYKAAARSRAPCVTITGGEPMLQKKECCTLARELRCRGLDVTLETSGSILMTTAEIGSFSTVVCDVKPPSTEMDHKNETRLMARLLPGDFVKCVIQDLEDFDWFEEFLERYPTRAKIAIGPRVLGNGSYSIEPRDLVHVMQATGRLDWRLNLQLHKIIWPDALPDPITSLKDFDRKKWIEGEV